MVVGLFTALEILELNGDFTVEELKKQYRLKALMYHPDKNPSADSSVKFMEIQESYEYLKKYRYDYGYDTQNDCGGGGDNDMDDDGIPPYKNILFSFLRGILAIEKNHQVLFHTILERVVNSCEENALKILEKLDITILKRVYDILKKYKDVLHFDNDFFEKIENIWKMRTIQNECVVLNPTIDDLFQEKVYKLKIDDEYYFIPLWHHKLVYDRSGVDFFVYCVPILPENMDIDENNNVSFSVNMKIADIWSVEDIPILIGSRVFYIKRDLLKMTPIQKVVLYDEGIPKVNTQNVYDIGEHADVIIHIYLDP